MNQTCLRVLSRPELEKPVLVVGLPEIGNIGKIVARLLIESSHARLFAELYSPSFPDYVLISKRGICRPPRYEFRTSTRGKNLLILSGDSQPPLEDVPAHYEVCAEVLEFASKLGCDFIVTVGGIPSAYQTREIHVAATSEKLAKEYSGMGAAIYKGGRIIGASGLLLGLAKKRGLKGICVLGSTTGLTSDSETAYRAYKFLRKVLGIDVQKEP